MRLFCFTYAGGNAAFFDLLESNLNESVEVIKLEYAGHGTRHRERFYDNFEELAQDMYKIIYRYCQDGQDYALFGYSMGSISVVEVLTLIMQRDEILAPIHVFLAAHEPYTKRELMDFDNDKTDEWIKHRTMKFGGIPEQLIANKSFWRIYLPIYRADYKLINEYDFDKLKLKSNIPATIFYSETDTPFEDMIQWKHYFSGYCKLICYEGNHFFIREHYISIAEIIEQKLGGEELGRFKKKRDD